MNIMKIKNWDDIPEGYTGIVEFEIGSKGWFNNGNLHREDGPAKIYKNGYKSWWLDEKPIWSSYDKLDLTNQIVLSKTKHPDYPSVQIWKIVGPNGLYEQFIIPGMEEIIIE